MVFEHGTTSHRTDAAEAEKQLSQIRLPGQRVGRYLTVSKLQAWKNTRQYL